MAHLRPIIQPKCWCGKKATVRLMDRWNGERGDFCKKHGDQALKKQQDNENA